MASDGAPAPTQSLDFRWRTDKLGDDIVVGSDGKSVTRTTHYGYGKPIVRAHHGFCMVFFPVDLPLSVLSRSSSWAAQLGEPWVRTGSVARVAVRLDAADDKGFFIGVVGRAYEEGDSE